MTLTLTNYEFRDKLMNCLARRATYTGPASYTTGGEVINNLTDFGWGRTHTLIGVAKNAALTAYRLLVFDLATQAVIWAVPDTGAEVAATTDLSGFTAEIFVTGR